MKINNSLKEKIIRSRKCTKYEFNDRVFDTLNEENAYWLGFLYADGNIAKESNALTFTLAKKDLETVQQFKKFMGANNPIFLRTNKIKKINKIYESYEFRINSVYLKHKLKELGIVPNKGAKIKYPKFISKLDLDGPFIRGYFDGDGNLTKYYSKNRKSRISIGFSSNKDFLNGITTVIENKRNYPSKLTKYNLNGKFVTIKEIVGLIGVTERQIRKKLQEGFTVEKIVEYYKNYTPQSKVNKGMKNEKLEYDGINLTFEQWSEITGLSIISINNRVKKGWTSYQVLLCPKSMRLEAFNSVADNLKMWLFIAWLLGHPKGKLLFSSSTNTLDKFIEMLKFFQRHNIVW